MKNQYKRYLIFSVGTVLALELLGIPLLSFFNISLETTIFSFIKVSHLFAVAIFYLLYEIKGGNVL